jgi:flavin-dependent dehydrogenase
MAPMKVLIVGGGIAGPALAHWLSRIGANITLVERSSQKRTSGQQLDCKPNNFGRFARPVTLYIFSKVSDWNFLQCAPKAYQQ